MVLIVVSSRARGSLYVAHDDVLFCYRSLFRRTWLHDLHFHVSLSVRIYASISKDKYPQRRLWLLFSHTHAGINTQRHYSNTTNALTSRSHQSIKQSPSQHKSSKAAEEPARPQLPRPPEKQACVKERLLLLLGGGSDANEVEEERGEEREEGVEEEAVVGLEAEDASCDAE